MTIFIQPATPDDAEDMVKAQIAAFHYDSVLYPQVPVGGPPDYDSVEDMQRKIERQDTYKFLADEVIIGGMVIFVQENGHYHLGVIFIDPAHQNQGIGTQALRFLEEQYPDAQLWTLDTPQWAIRNQHFYEKMGYIKARAFEDDGFPLFAYEKRKLNIQ